MPEIELSAGTIEYEDSGDNGPIVVLLHGLAMDSSLWRKVVSELRADHRCVVPTLPVGAHRRPMRDNADLSLRGQAKLQAEFLEALDLREVTLVGNDLGLFQVTACEYPERIARLVITSCEAFENIPPDCLGTRSPSLPNCQAVSSPWSNPCGCAPCVACRWSWAGWRSDQSPTRSPTPGCVRC